LTYRAKIVLLHVLERMPGYIEGRLAGMFGEEQWKEMLQAHETKVRQKLIGKRSSS
jgi:hypothetical protein